MKKLLMTAIAAVGLSSAAMATDLVVGPVPLDYPTQTLPFFVGVNAGGIYNTEDYVLGINAGTEFNQNILGEIAYDYIDSDNASVLTGNVILQPQEGLITPYVLGGVGYRWADSGDEAVWDLGLGAKVAITDNIDLDLRYRHIVGFDTDEKDDVVSAGILFKF